MRGIAADPIVLRQNWLRAYDFVTDRVYGAQRLCPLGHLFGQIGKNQVSIEVSSVIRASPEEGGVAWTQRRYENGSLASTDRWTAIFTIVLRTPTDAERLRKNPRVRPFHQLVQGARLMRRSIVLLRFACLHLAVAPTSRRLSLMTMSSRQCRPLIRPRQCELSNCRSRFRCTQAPTGQDQSQAEIKIRRRGSSLRTPQRACNRHVPATSTPSRSIPIPRALIRSMPRRGQVGHRAAGGRAARGLRPRRRRRHGALGHWKRDTESGSGTQS